MGKVLVVIFILTAHISLSQNQIRFERITVEDGLSQSSVKSIVQDKYGYLWVATLDGINKYDGNKFYQYYHLDNSPETIPRNDIHRLFIDKNQNLWVSSSGYLSLYIQEEDKFITYRLNNKDIGEISLVVNDLHHKTDNTLLLATNYGVWEFNSSDGLLKRTTTYSQFDNNDIVNIEFTNNNNIWLATKVKVYLKPEKNDLFEEILSSDHKISFYYSKSTQEAYFHTRDSLCKYNPSSNRIKSIYKFSEAEQVGELRMPLLKLTNGELWVMRRDLFIYNSDDQFVRKLKYVPQDPFALSSDYLACIYQTKDEVVWVGTNGMGLNKFSPRFSVFNYFGSFAGAPISLSSPFVTSVATYDDNTIYVSTMEGLDIIDQKANKTLHVDVNSIDGDKSRINTILLDQHNNLWLGTSHGLRKWNGSRLEFIKDSKMGSSNLYINDLSLISNSELLVATDIGIFLYNTKEEESSVLSTRSTAVINTINDALWSEKYDTIVQYNMNDFTTTREQKILPEGNLLDASIKCFYEDSEGTIWIGSSGGGLIRYNSQEQQFKAFTEKDGLPNSVIYGILEDQEGNLWLSTNKGIAVFNKEEMRCTRSFNTTHGLQGNEFNTNAFYKSPSGTMYFGGVNGLSFFEPQKALRLTSEIPKCIMTSLLINGTRQSEIGNGQSFNQIVNDKKMELAWSERNFGFEISSLGFSYPAHTSYQYILEGYDQSWTFIENERRIQFTNIPPGDYTLKAKASNSFGEWEEDGLEIAITVNPPLYLTPWFIIVAIAATLFIIYVIFQWRTRRLRYQTLLLERLVNERTRALQIQQEEIQAANEELSAQAELMDHRNTELEKVKASLEERVAERTTTLRSLNEELVDQNTKLEQFTFITAHNIKGPVAQVKGLINLIKTEDTEVLKLLTGSINDLDQVISDLTVVLNIRKGMGNLIEPVELKDQLMLAIKTLKDELQNANGKINLHDFNEVHIEGLRPYVYSIFYNLISNAIKYRSEERNVVITCTTDQIEEEKVRIIIKDNGIGIDMTYAEDKIFNLYQRFHLERNGKGFGLFLTRAHVEAMKGSITVESQLNVGTTFTIEFPIFKETLKNV